MKKILAYIIAFLLTVFSIPGISFAQPLTLEYDGAQHLYTGPICSLKINGQAIATDVAPVIIKDRLLVPARAVFEKIGAEVGWDAASQTVSLSLGEIDMTFKINDTNVTVNDKTVTLDVPAKNINGRAMLPVRFVGEQLDMKVGWYPEEALVTLDDVNTEAPTNIKDIKYEKKNDIDYITLLVDGKISFTTFTLTAPNRIVADITGLDVPYAQQQLDINGAYVNNLRYAWFSNNVARVVLDLSEQAEYLVEASEDKLLIIVGSNQNGGGGDNGGEEAPKPDPEPEPEPEPDNGDFKVLHQWRRDKDTVTIDVADCSYKVTRLADPDRLNIDIKGFEQSIQKYEKKVDSTRVSSILYAKLDATTLRVVVKTDGPMDYTEDEKNGRLVLNIQNPEGSTEPSVEAPGGSVVPGGLVVIDAGHGDHDPGAVYGSLKEKEFALDIALRLNALLRDKNVKTYMTRDDDTFVDLYTRANVANDMNADLFLSIHINANNKTARGTETLYCPSELQDEGFSDKWFAQIVQEKLIASLGTVNRKIVPRPNLVVLRETKMPSALAEIAFIDNSSDRELLLKEEFRQKAAEALCEAIIQALEEMEPEP